MDGADGYNIYRKEAGGSWNRIVQVKDGQKTSYIDKTAKSSKVYIYTVRAYCQADGQTSLCDYNRTGVYWIDTPKMKSTQVYSEMSERYHGQVEITTMSGWYEVDGADGYYVYRKIGNGKWQKIDEVLSTNSVVGLIMERNLPSGQTYTYTVRAYCKVNGKITEKSLVRSQL